MVFNKNAFLYSLIILSILDPLPERTLLYLGPWVHLQGLYGYVVVAEVTVGARLSYADTKHLGVVMAGVDCEESRTADMKHPVVDMDGGVWGEPRTADMKLLVDLTGGGYEGEGDHGDH